MSLATGISALSFLTVIKNKKNRLLDTPLGVVGAPCYGYGQSSPCMHRVWIEVDSGVPVRKLTRYHMVFCAKSSLTCSRAKFSSRVHLDLEASRMFGTTPRKKIWSHFVQSYFVRTLAYGTWLRSLMNALVSELESIRAFPSENKYGIVRQHCHDRTSRRVPEWT